MESKWRQVNESVWKGNKIIEKKYYISKESRGPPAMGENGKRLGKSGKWRWKGMTD